MRILICGDRNYTNRLEIRRIMAELSLKPNGTTTIIHGGAKGVDTLAGEEAARLGFEVIEFKADWDHFGKAAGQIRNLTMLRKGRPDYVIAFHDDITNSKGTLNMLSQARKAKVRCTIVEVGEWHSWPR